MRIRKDEKPKLTEAETEIFIIIGSVMRARPESYQIDRFSWYMIVWETLTVQKKHHLVPIPVEFARILNKLEEIGLLERRKHPSEFPTCN
jgi:hypothetical protein